MKINIKNTEKLAEAIASAEVRCSARTISAKDIQKEAAHIETKLSKILAKKDWPGIKFTIDLNAQSFPGKYRGIPESTKFTLERFSSGWFVTAIYRGRTASSRKNEARLTESQKVAMADYILTNYL